MKKNKLLFILILLWTINCFSQFSKTHYIPPLSASSSVGAEEQYLYISTPSTTPVNFVIKQLGSSNITGTVSRDTPFIYNIGFGNDTQLIADQSIANSVISNKGYIVEAEDVVYATTRVIAGNTNQAGELVSKGLAGLGTQFRIGAYINTGTPSYGTVHYTFASILATENNTTISFSDIHPGVVLVNNAAAGNTPSDVVLNAGESFVIAAQGPTLENKDGLIGALISSDKPIAVNCGSFGGTNGEMSNLDLGFDQIVSAERTGSDYIFVKSTGLDNVERVLLVAHEDNTDVYLNGNATPNYTLNAGDYVALVGSDYNTDGNMFVHTSKNVFAYQSVGDNTRTDQANQELFFVPPLSCETPLQIDNIPALEQIGTRTFIGRITIITKVGSALSFIINATPYTLATLPAGTNVIGPTNVTGNPNYVTYTITGLSGNLSVFSTSELYLASYGSDGAATFGGYFSGFTFKPEITFQPVDITQSNCIPNINLEVSSLSGFNTFQWYFNDTPIAGATSSSYTPTQPGYYFVSATITTCGTTLISDKIPVSICPTDSDSDNVNNNADQDYDNDGITNCSESYGNQTINLSNLTAGSISVGTFSNTYTGTTTTTGLLSPTPVAGSSDGSIITDIPIGSGNSVTYKLNFASPMTVGIEYPATAIGSDLMNANSEYVVNSPILKTVTVLNPNNQLLIDTNYDGIYESGVTEFSSFEIRFRLNSTTPLPAGTGTFKFLSYNTNSISITHKNLSVLDTNRSTFKFYAVCVPKDSDNDEIPDQMDYDSDNDSVPDYIESQGITFSPLTHTDTNNDGIDNVFGTGLTPSDTDNDGVPDYLDLDSDNDGIFDLEEFGSNAADTNSNGAIDGSLFGTNGIANSIETSPDSGVLNFTITNSDTDTIPNIYETDSDGDGCNDVIEAGFLDPNGDGYLGNSVPVTVNAWGVVTSGAGYTNPNANYTIGAPISITTQPQDSFVCELQTVTFTLTSNASSFQWQVSTDGINWANITNNATYSGATTVVLSVTNVPANMDGYKYRAFINRIGNSCGMYSDVAIMTIWPLPVINSPLNLVQCDNDYDGISTFNLRQKETEITSDYASMDFTYYTSLAGAATQNTSLLISNPIAYTTNNTTIWVRVENSNGCFRVAQLNLVVSATQIPAGTAWTFEECDDVVSGVSTDVDGTSVFDFSSVTTDIQAILPTTAAYTISYYKNEADALAETDSSGNSLAISDITNYRNIGYPNSQQIWIRIESDLDNACYGLGPYITLTVNPLPTINENLNGGDNELVCTSSPSFTVTLDAGIIAGTASPSDYTYQWSLNGTILPGETNYTINVNSEGTYSVEVTTTEGCFRVRSIPVVASEIASIQSINIVDLSDVNSVLVTVTGSGDYVYSIGDIDGPYQTSNLFTNVAMGIYTVYVKDLNGCGIVQQTISVLGIPKYFTPNGDGINDTWNIRGVSAEFYPNAIIDIFDRYGKLIKQLGAAGSGWDGTYNGKPALADDYWFTIKLDDGRSAKGHFALKR